jgi:hypothetical protein
MSEGERIWFWRNRTENERWFWEVFAWERLIFREWLHAQHTDTQCGSHARSLVCYFVLAHERARAPCTEICAVVSSPAAVLAIAAYEYLVPSHFLWSVVVPIALVSWLTARLITPGTFEFWLIAFFGFYRKVLPEWAAWWSSTAFPAFGF